MSKILDGLYTPINLLIEKLNVKVFYYSELTQNNIAINYPECTWDGFYCTAKDYIGIKDEPRDEINAVLMHELIHLTGSKYRLNRNSVSNFSSKITEKDAQTEEITAYLGMFKLASHFNFELEEYANIVWEYIKKLDKADHNKADIDSDRAVDYLLSFLEERKTA